MISPPSTIRYRPNAGWLASLRRTIPLQSPPVATASAHPILAIGVSPLRRAPAPLWMISPIRRSSPRASRLSRSQKSSPWILRHAIPILAGRFGADCAMVSFAIWGRINFSTGIWTGWTPAMASRWRNGFANDLTRRSQIPKIHDVDFYDRIRHAPEARPRGRRVLPEAILRSLGSAEFHEWRIPHLA